MAWVFLLANILMVVLLVLMIIDVLALRIASFLFKYPNNNRQ
jgi:hypothetical protein